MERELIGRFLTDNEAFATSSLSEKHFLDPLCREAYRAISAALAAGDEANLVTVTMHSKALKSRAGELSAMTSEAWMGPTHNAERKVTDAYRRRALKALAEAIAESEPEAALQAIDAKLEEIYAETDTDRLWTVSELLMPCIDTIEDRYHGRTTTDVSTGFPQLDDLIGGFKPRQLYLIGARPSDGKSAIMLNMALHASRHVPVLYVSAESSKEENMMRLISDAGSVDSHRIATGMLSQADFASLATAGEILNRANLFFYDRPNVELSRVVSMTRLAVRKHGVRVVFVDYTQLIEADRKFDTRAEAVAHISKRLKQLARETGISVVAAAQLTRNAHGKRPTLADFGESSQLEKDADVAMLLDHERDEHGDKTGRVFGRVDKHRHGPTGAIRMQFVGKYVRFAEEARDDAI